VHDFFDIEFLSVVLIRLDFVNATYFNKFKLDENLLVVLAEFDHINRFKIFFQNVFEMIDVHH
jgi:hypothetical protein